MRWLGRISLATTVFFAALVVFWSTAPLPLRQNIVFAATPVACFPNPNANPGFPPNFVNSCPIPASALNMLFAHIFTNPNEVNVLASGAKCDATTDDSAAFTSAMGAMSVVGGGIVDIPATGHSCVLKTGQVIPAGVSLQGQAGYNQPSNVFDNTEADWETSGSWIRCDDQVNDCLQIRSPGSHIDGLNFWYTQPAPVGAACGATCIMTHTFTPTAYPFTILVGTVKQNGDYISNLNIINGYNCVDIEGNSNEGLGINSYGFHEDHVRLGCFNVVQRMAYIDNTISIHDWRDQSWWYIGATDLLGYKEGDSTSTGHQIGMDMYYVANAQISDVEFYEDWAGIRATDATVTSGLGMLMFAAQALQVTNMSFNQTCQGIILANGTTHFSGRFTNIIAAGDVQTSGTSGQCSAQWPTFFNLSSDNADVSINNLDGYELDQIASIGNGSSGVLHLTGNIRAGYSDFGASHAFTIAANGALDMPSDFNALFPFAGALSAINGSTNWPTVPATPTTWLNAPAGNARAVIYTTGLTARWGTTAGAEAETGSNVGSNYGVYRYADNGSFIDIPLGISRSNGLITILDGYYLPGVTIASLPTCNAGSAGQHWTVSNGVASPTFGGPVSATGITPDPVFCNGTSWVYQ